MIITSVIIYQLWNSKSRNEGFSGADPAAFDKVKSECSSSIKNDKIKSEYVLRNLETLNVQLSKYDTLVQQKNKLVKPTETDGNKNRNKYNEYYNKLSPIQFNIQQKITEVNTIIGNLAGSKSICAGAINNYLDTRYPSSTNIFNKVKA